MYRLNEKQIQQITEYIFPEDALEKADVIFIPGCARPEHTEEAARLYREGYAPLVIPSGGFTKKEGSFQGVKAGGDKYGTNYACEADFLEAVLLAGQVPKEAILKEREATYTLENAEKTRELLQKHHIPVKSAILCCKAYHARRAGLYYSMVFPEVKLMIHPVTVNGITKKNWYLTGQGRAEVFGELTRIGQQLAMMEGRIEYGDFPEHSS